MRGAFELGVVLLMSPNAYRPLKWCRSFSSAFPRQTQGPDLTGSKFLPTFPVPLPSSPPGSLPPSSILSPGPVPSSAPAPRSVPLPLGLFTADLTDVSIVLF